jgi:hypothetical protein
MTPIQFAKAECANYNADGSCLSGPRKKCALYNRDRCDYFEKCVLPLADSPSPTGESGLQTYRQQAREIYLASQELKAPKKSKDRFCECGAILEKRQRICPKCRDERRKATFRNSQQKKRLPCQQLTTFSQS